MPCVNESVNSSLRLFQNGELTIRSYDQICRERLTALKLDGRQAFIQVDDLLTESEVAADFASDLEQDSLITSFSHGAVPKKS